MENINNNGNGLGGLLITAGLILFGAYKLSNYEPKDTVNYRLFYKGKIVYEGKCYTDRLTYRLKEHKRSGKIFDDYTCSRIKKNSVALYHEELRINKYKPKYNVHHNC